MESPATIFRVLVLRLALAVLGLGVAGPSPVSAADVGSVVRVRGEASAQAAGQNRSLAAGAPVALGDRLQTGPGARLEIRLADGSDLTLGERADFTIDELSVGGDGGTALFSRVAGALLFAAGDIAKLPRHRIEIASNAGTIGIRGTTVWGGTIKPGSLLDVLLIEGAAEVRTAAGTVLLDQPGQGTSVTAPGAAPQQPARWADELRASALATVSFTAP